MQKNSSVFCVLHTWHLHETALPGLKWESVCLQLTAYAKCTEHKHNGDKLKLFRVLRNKGSMHICT